MRKRHKKISIDLGELVSFRLVETTVDNERVFLLKTTEGTSVSYASTLQKFQMEGQPDRYFFYARKAFEEGFVNEQGLELLVQMEKLTLKEYYDDVQSGEREQFPHGTHLNRANVAILTELALETIEGFETANREGKIKLIRDKIIGKNEETGKRVLQFFLDCGLGGMLMHSRYLDKKNSPLAVLELYNRERKLNLFDRSQGEYLGRWEIRKRGMWKGKAGKDLAVEAIEDVLWKIPGYKTATREEKIRLIRTYVMGYRSPTGKEHGTLQFLKDSGLSGMLSKS